MTDNSMKVEVQSVKSFQLTEFSVVDRPFGVVCSLIDNRKAVEN